jgi:iron complex outermembrane receptor protein
MSAWAQQAPSIAAESDASTTLPGVSVTATRSASKDGLVTQGRAPQVGKSSVSLQDTPFAAAVVEVAQIRETGAKNIQDALLYTAGVYSGRYGFDTRGDWAAVRGMAPSFYLDGLRSSFGYYNKPRQDIYTLEQIEVLKGPSSVLYGQAELGGIVNAVTKQPRKATHREVEVQLGSHDRKQVATDLTGALSADGQWLYRLVALKRDSGTQVDHVHDDAQVVMPALTWQPSAATSVTLNYLHQQNKGQVSAQFLPSKGTTQSAPLGQIPTSAFAGEPGWDRYDTLQNEWTLLVKQQLSPDWRLNVSLRQTNTSSITREIYANTVNVPTDAGVIDRTIHTADRKTDVFAGDVRIEGRIDLGPTRHTVSAGIDHQNAYWEEYNYSSSATGGGKLNIYNPVYGHVNTAALTWSDNPDNQIIQTGFYAMDHMEWNQWVLSVALRHDKARNRTWNIAPVADVELDNAATTGRVGLMYRLGAWAPYVSYSEAFIPNLGLDKAGGYLKPTSGDQKEAGVKYLSTSGDTSAALAWFDIQQTNRVADGKEPGGVEQVGARVLGWEAEVRHRMGAWEWLGNLTNFDAADRQTGKRLNSIAERTASAWTQYRFAGNWRAGLGARYIGTVTGAAGTPEVPSVTLYDAMIGYASGPWDVRFDVKNLADKTYVSWCRGLNRDCGYGDRLNANLTARYTF